MLWLNELISWLGQKQTTKSLSITFASLFFKTEMHLGKLAGVYLSLTELFLT